MSRTRLPPPSAGTRAHSSRPCSAPTRRRMIATKPVGGLALAPRSCMASSLVARVAPRGWGRTRGGPRPSVTTGGSSIGSPSGRMCRRTRSMLGASPPFARPCRRSHSIWRRRRGPHRASRPCAARRRASSHASGDGRRPHGVHARFAVLSRTTASWQQPWSGAGKPRGAHARRRKRPRPTAGSPQTRRRGHAPRSGGRPSSTWAVRCPSWGRRMSSRQRSAKPCCAGCLTQSSSLGGRGTRSRRVWWGKAGQRPPARARSRSEPAPTDKGRLPWHSRCCPGVRWATGTKRSRPHGRSRALARPSAPRSGRARSAPCASSLAVCSNGSSRIDAREPGV